MKTENTPCVLQVENLKKSFGQLHVLNGFSFSLHRGENLVVLGRSGSGKSVLIKCIIRLITADEGQVEVLGQNMFTLDEQALDDIRSRIGFLFQSNALYDSMTVRENLEFPLRRHCAGSSRTEIALRIQKALDDVRLPHTADMMPEELSGGMRKRIALARTLILAPDIILYDEPTTGLDPITAREIIDLMKEIRDKYQTAAVIISHDMKCVERAGDRILLLEEGVCKASGTFDELRRSPIPTVKSFFD